MPARDLLATRPEIECDVDNFNNVARIKWKFEHFEIGWKSFQFHLTLQSFFERSNSVACASNITIVTIIDELL